MTLDWSPMPWDSEFFGVPIGEVDLNGCDVHQLEQVEREARDAGIACLYGSLEPVDAQVAHLVQTLGYRLVEVATEFDLRPSEPPIPRPPDCDFRLGTPEDVPLVVDIALQMAEWSRFAVDPRFGLDAARRMQMAWLDRAAAGTDGVHSMVIAVGDSEVFAFIGRTTSPAARVDAVGTTRRGSGAARYLIQQAREWAAPEPLLGGWIAARNVPALRFVSHCNYRPHRVKYVFHRWLDEDKP